jgi:hypothetical protein
LKTNFSERQGQLSPDGRWVAYMSNESGHDEIYVRPFVQDGAGAAGSLVSTTGGIHPVWRTDGKELYYLAPDGKLMAAPIQARDTTLEVGVPVVLFQTHIFGGGVDNGLGRQYDVSRDGRFLINTLAGENGSAPITLVLNWHPPKP